MLEKGIHFRRYVNALTENDSLLSVLIFVLPHPCLENIWIGLEAFLAVRVIEESFCYCKVLLEESRSVSHCPWKVLLEQSNFFRRVQVLNFLQSMEQSHLTKNFSDQNIGGVFVKKH